MTPLPARADPFTKKGSDRRQEASIVAAVGAAVVPAIDEFTFRRLKALGRFCHINRNVIFHAFAL
jgi:hypothetical protein